MYEVSPWKALHQPDFKFEGMFLRETREVKLRPYAGPRFDQLTGIFPGQGVLFEGRFGELLASQLR